MKDIIASDQLKGPRQLSEHTPIDLTNPSSYPSHFLFPSSYPAQTKSQMSKIQIQHLNEYD